MKGRKRDQDEQLAPSLCWLERPVCLEWPERDGERSSPSLWPAGSLLWMVGGLIQALRVKPSR
jgi:hypothetical protein